MKRIRISIFLIWALSSNMTFAQRTLAPGLQPYAANLTYTVVKALHRAGFDMPSMVAPAAKGAAPRSVLQLDSTKTFYGYNLNAPGDSTPLFRTIYKYPFDDTKIEVDYMFENNAWLPQAQTTLVSDGQQRLVEVLAEVYDPVTQKYNPDSRLEIFPHGDSPEHIDSFLTYLWDSTIMDWHIILSVRNAFDAQDHLLESVSSFDYFGDPLIFREVYSYDANGDNHLIEEFAILGNDEFPSSRTDLVYLDHRPIEVTLSVFDSLGLSPQNRDNYSYTLFGALRKNLKFEWNAANGTWYLYQTIEYNYDNAQRLVGKETAYLPSGAPEEREFVYYVYIDGENLSLEWFYLWDEDQFDWVLDSKKHYYYKGVTSVRPDPVTRALAMWPNPTSGLVQFALDDDAAVQVFDAAGHLVQSRLVQSGQTMDITMLPAGIYSVTARQEANFYTGKIVKQSDK